jgi:hypothetical protein
MMTLIISPIVLAVVTVLAVSLMPSSPLVAKVQAQGSAATPSIVSQTAPNSVSGSNWQNSPIFQLCGQYYTSPNSVADCWNLQDILVNNTSSTTSTLSLFHTVGGPSGTQSVQVPQLQVNGTAAGMISLVGSSTADSVVSSAASIMAPASVTGYIWTMPNAAPGTVGPLLITNTSSTVGTISYGTLQGNTTQVQLASGSTTTSEPLAYDTNGNAIDLREIVNTAVPSSDTLTNTGGTFATTRTVSFTGLKIGSIIEIHAKGRYTTTSTASPVINIQIDVGGSSICPAAGANLGLSASQTTAPWSADCYIQINTTGTPGTAIAWGSWSAATAALSPNAKAFGNTGTTSFATSSNQTFSILETASGVTGQTFQLDAIYTRTLY